jgi:hypothetical protein
MNEENLRMLIVLCGWGHIILSIVSLVIPKILDWKGNLKALQPLLRQMFWTYAAYILVINFCFGLVSIFGAAELLNKSFIAISLTFFIGIYWLGRIAIQFFYFDKKDTPKGLIYLIGEIGLVSLFALFTVVYLTAYAFNISWI